jgi:hypothetical protein
MALKQDASMDIGLRYALETGLSFVRLEEDAVALDGSVLEDLAEIFSEAGRGSQAVQRQELLVEVGERPAFERFTLFFRYLKDAMGEELPGRLAEAASVFRELRDEEAVDQARRQRAAELIEKLLMSMRRETAMSRLVAPQNFIYET